MTPAKRDRVIEALRALSNEPTVLVHQRRVLRELDLKAPVPFTAATWTRVTKRIGDLLRENVQ